MKLVKLWFLVAVLFLVGACTSTAAPQATTAIPAPVGSVPTMVLPAQTAIIPDLTKMVEGDGSWELVNAMAVLDFDGPFWEDPNIQPRLYLQPQGVAADASNVAIAYVQGLELTDGVIEVDLRGRDVDQASFLGIAFHGVDGKTFEAIYFRPFNFRTDDPERKIHAVQYICWPDYPWEYLRENKNGIYEKAVNPAPLGNEWFHARIEISGKTVTVYVNDAKEPSLTVERLADRQTGKVGLFADTVSGAFANLIITPAK